jgi:hypothetical protein
MAYLATWGYVQPEWLRTDVALLTPDAFRELLARTWPRR